ncbi:MAG: leucine-rich repeat domain-containing protein, partial [Cyanobacteriota bacterium]|nr:leucine-rich repeat domain-containing protein [Cyanobacteriota bacterium]
MSNYREIDWDEFQKDIKQAKRVHHRSFSLIGYGLTEIPTEIFEIESLRELDLRFNRINNIPAEIYKLTNLHCLDMEGNQIETLPTALAQLTKLDEL